jgi:Fe-S oxidoreductase
MSNFFDGALHDLAQGIIDACTHCGKCIEICPAKTPGRVTAPAQEVVSGVIDILRTGDGPEASRLWASTCKLTGDCIKACEYGVNPRFMLTMARFAMAKPSAEPRDQRREDLETPLKLSLEVTAQSRMELLAILHLLRTFGLVRQNSIDVPSEQGIDGQSIVVEQHQDHADQREA